MYWVVDVSNGGVSQQFGCGSDGTGGREAWTLRQGRAGRGRMPVGIEPYLALFNKRYMLIICKSFNTKSGVVESVTSPKQVVDCGSIRIQSPDWKVNVLHQIINETNNK